MTLLAKARLLFVFSVATFFRLRLSLALTEAANFINAEIVERNETPMSDGRGNGRLNGDRQTEKLSRAGYLLYCNVTQ